MTEEEQYKLRYPIGEYEVPATITDQHISRWKAELKNFPSQLFLLVDTLTPKELDQRYRPGGWTVRQVIHHCADSHMNMLMRIKLTLSEVRPTIKPYDENAWAALADANVDGLNDSLMMITGIHNKLSLLLEHASREDLKRTFLHPEHGRSFTIAETIGNYAWHSMHHLAHIKQALG